ncbi:hypothetical protein BJ508DRAFT_110399 [Ascobolus immersus RN42]|uniref:Uncharacterized protein n=1 Tax=Ascobolus immersus RN42 TaxID=1160509 RepID=A0A3N4HCU8_ASCIM|nr:hypothetical protein BJ508DRAFT_110399 [Ascobolus immersus RN42]
MFVPKHAKPFPQRPLIRLTFLLHPTTTSKANTTTYPSSLPPMNERLVRGGVTTRSARKPVFSPETASKLPSNRQNQPLQFETWTDIPTVHFFDPDEQRGSALQILKLLAHQSPANQDVPAQPLIAAVLSESETHITVLLNTGLQITLTEPGGPKTARIRNMTFSRSSPPSPTDAPAPLANPLTSWILNPLPYSLSPTPTQTPNLHITYRNAPHLSSYSLESKPLHSQWSRRTVPPTLPCPFYITSYRTPYPPNSLYSQNHLPIPAPSSPQARLLFDATHLLLSVSFLLELSTTPTLDFETTLLTPHLGHLSSCGIAAPGMYSIGARTVVLDQMVGPPPDGSHQRIQHFWNWPEVRCFRRKRWLFTLAGAGGELVRGLGWLGWLLGEKERAMAEDGRCCFWNCWCWSAGVMRGVVRAYRPEEYEVYEAERLRREVVEDGLRD